MCFDVQAQPPDPPVTGTAASAMDLTLRSRDGAEFAVCLARAGAPNGAGVVILPDVRGLFKFYKELTTRFAAAGVEAIAIDYFGRTAGTTPRSDDFDYMPHVTQTRVENIAADVAAAIAYLRALPNPPRSIFTVGFCFGGSHSFLQAANKHGLAGVVGFYGMPAGASRFGIPAPIDLAGEFECPVLGLFGGADQAVSAETIEQFAAALTQAGVAHELHTYPGAPHSFFDRRYEEYARESADAWERVLAFLRKYGN
jgi:carboxymethylenebutenolidase